MEDRPLTRQELAAGYERPYVRWLPVAWRLHHVPADVGIALAALGGFGLIDAFDDGDVLYTWIGIVIAAALLSWSLWITVAAALVIRDRLRDWEESDHELAAVRRKRPHAAEADPEVAHSEYAVSVGDDGELVTWRFRPIAANEEQGTGETVLTGRPCYAAKPVEWTDHDPVDAALAAEQLAEAQEAAAGLERAAIERTIGELEARDRALEIEAESRSTGAALRGITGQSD